MLNMLSGLMTLRSLLEHQGALYWCYKFIGRG
jgi:hypothetical protein